jgi:hypothetical protein
MVTRAVAVVAVQALDWMGNCRGRGFLAVGNYLGQQMGQKEGVHEPSWFDWAQQGRGHLGAGQVRDGRRVVVHLGG